MIKIVLIIPLDTSYSIFLKELGDYLIDKNFKLYVITKLSRPDLNLSSKINFINLDIPRGFSVGKMLKASYKLHKILLQINPLIVHAHFQTAIMAYRLTGLTSKFISIASVHGSSFVIQDSYLKKKLYKSIEYFAYKPFKTILVMNQADLEAFTLLKLNVKLYESTGVGCLIENFDPSKFSIDGKLSLKRKLGINDKDLVLIFVGRFTQFKGFDIVIKTMKKLSHQNAKVKLILLGKEDEIHQTGLTKEEDLFYKNSSTVVNIGFSNDVSKYLNIADLTFFPSQKEGLPVNLMESLSMGVPVLTYNSRGCVDLVKSGVNGFIINDLKIDSYVELIMKIINKPKILYDLREQMDITANREIYDRKNFIEAEYKRYGNFSL